MRAGRVVGAFLVLLAYAMPANLPAQAASGAELAGDRIEALDSLARSLVESEITVGLGIGVYRYGRPVFSRGYGLADLEHGVPATDSTVFRIGSVTKQFTAAAILRLREEGRLSLDDELTRFLPDFPMQGHRVTIRHALNHTSGIKSYTGLGERWQRVMPLDLTHEELLALFRDEPFDFAPGTGFAYNNSGYYLLGMIIEELTGMGYDEYLQEAFFGPLGLRDTSYCWERPLIPRRASGYQRVEGEIRNAAPLGMTQPHAAGALCSSVRDLLRWEQALRGGEVISSESYRRMMTPEALPEDAGMQYGFGLYLGELDGVRKVEHGGGINGFNALLSHYPEEGLTIVTLVNLNGPGAQRAGEGAARILLGRPATVP